MCRSPHCLLLLRCFMNISFGEATQSNQTHSNGTRGYILRLCPASPCQPVRDRRLAVGQLLAPHLYMYIHAAPAPKIMNHSQQHVRGSDCHHLQKKNGTRNSSSFRAFRLWCEISVAVSGFGEWRGVKEGRKGVDLEDLDPD